MIRGSAILLGSVRGRAYGVGGVNANAVYLKMIGKSKAVAFGEISGSASQTRNTGLHHFMAVRPEQPQQLVWLVPQVGVEYTIETSTNLKWKIK